MMFYIPPSAGDMRGEQEKRAHVSSLKKRIKAFTWMRQNHCLPTRTKKR